MLRPVLLHACCPIHSARHGFDTAYNYLERSAWSPTALAQRVGILLLTKLTFVGALTLLVEDTLAHQRGKSVWGRGWFRDAVARTKKRVATAAGHHGVVVAVAVCRPGTGPLLALPRVARLHRPGQGQPRCAAWARPLRAEVRNGYPGRRFRLVGEGAYATKTLGEDLDERVSFVGRLRGDAAGYAPRVPTSKPGKRGPKAKKGPRLPSPKEAAAKADRKRSERGAWVWQEVPGNSYGCTRGWKAFASAVVWPTVLGLRPLQVVGVRDPEGRRKDA